jgi:putative transposase
LYRYFLTFCCHSKQRRFISQAVVDLALSQIRRAAAQEQFAIPAYCFMPDHLHLLVEGLTDTSNCLRFIRRAKQLSGFHYSREWQQTLWQRYGFEHVLRSDEDTHRVARYIFENPIRAGLVSCAEQYEFLGSDTHSLTEILPETSG